MKKLEELLEWGGVKKDITLLVISGAALLASLFHLKPFAFDFAWVAILLCGIPILLEAVIGLVTSFDMKADVLVSLALIASVLIGEDFAAGEVAFIMQLGALLEDLIVAKARAGIEKLVHLTPQTVRKVENGIVVIALTAAVLTWLITGEMIRAVTILVVFCPCALVLATPTAIMAAIGNATRHGFLVRERDALERLASVSEITFDKTGTLTYRTPEVAAVRSFRADLQEEELYRLAAAAKQRSEHPLGKAVVNCYRRREEKELPPAWNFTMLPGRGVRALFS